MNRSELNQAMGKIRSGSEQLAHEEMDRIEAAFIGLECIASLTRTYWAAKRRDEELRAAERYEESVDAACEAEETRSELLEMLGEVVSDQPDSWPEMGMYPVRCDECGKWMEIVRPGKYQCDCEEADSE